MSRIEAFVRAVLDEDIGRGDLYAKVASSKEASGYIVAKSEGILAGLQYAKVLAYISAIEITWHCEDGAPFKKGERIASFSGASHTLLQIERTLLNLLHHASGIASATHAFASRIKPYGVMLLDTRKTRPLLREFEKYATRVGGGVNHRMGLDDALMLKDTHLKTIDNLALYIKEARKHIPFTATIEVECESVKQAKEAMQAGADIIMCDNMSCQSIEEVVAYRNSHYKGIKLEASGNITLDTIEDYAKTGVDAISSGSTIHQAVWPDFSMKIH